MTATTTPIAAWVASCEECPWRSPAARESEADADADRDRHNHYSHGDIPGPAAPGDTTGIPAVPDGHLRNLRTIGYRAFCEACREVVSPAPRTTEKEADIDLTAHINIVHDGRETPERETGEQ